MLIRTRQRADGPTPIGPWLGSEENGTPFHRQRQPWPGERGFATGARRRWVSAPTQLLCQEPWFWAQNANRDTTALRPDFARNASTNLVLENVGADR